MTQRWQAPDRASEEESTLSAEGHTLGSGLQWKVPTSEATANILLARNYVQGNTSSRTLTLTH